MKHLFFLMLCMFVFSSCSQSDDFILDDENVEAVDVKKQLKPIEFTYKGKLYNSEYYEKGDSIIILDQDVQDVYNKLGEMEDRLAVVDENNRVTYYDNEEEYLSVKKSEPQLRTTETRPYHRVYIRLYKNVNTLYNPTTTMLVESKYYLRNRGIASGENVLLEYPDLRVHNHNDNISLAKVGLYIGNMTPDYNFRGEAILEMYEHLNYTGEYCAGWASAAWNDKQNAMKQGVEVGETYEIRVKARKKSNGDSFNDIISSLKIRLLYYNMNPSTSNEEGVYNGREITGERESNDRGKDRGDGSGNRGTGIR